MPTRNEKNRKRKKVLGSYPSLTVMISIMMSIFVIGLFGLILINFGPPKILPNEFMWNNYQKASEMAPFGRYFLNSIFVSSMSTIFVLITTILAAFSFSKYEFKGKNFIFTILLATLMIPSDVLLVTNFATINALGLYDTSIAMFLPFIGSIFYIFLVRQFFISIPNELYLTSKVDGCSDFRYLMKMNSGF